MSDRLWRALNPTCALRKSVGMTGQPLCALLRARVGRGRTMTQVQLAQVVGVHQSTVSKWCTGKDFPEAWRVDAIAQATGLSADDILDGIKVGSKSRQDQREQPVAPEAVPDHTHPEFAQIIEELLSLRERLDASTEAASEARAAAKTTHRARKGRAQQIQSEGEGRPPGAGSTDAGSQ